MKGLAELVQAFERFSTSLETVPLRQTAQKVRNLIYCYLQETSVLTSIFSTENPEVEGGGGELADSYLD